MSCYKLGIYASICLLVLVLIMAILCYDSGNYITSDSLRILFYFLFLRFSISLYFALRLR